MFKNLKVIVLLALFCVSSVGISKECDPKELEAEIIEEFKELMQEDRNIKISNLKIGNTISHDEKHIIVFVTHNLKFIDSGEELELGNIATYDKDSCEDLEFGDFSMRSVVLE